VLGYESGVARTVDPLAGSYFVEQLTDEVEAGARRLIEQVEALGGAAAAIEQGFFQKAIADSAWRQQQAQESGAQVVVGVNRFVDESLVPEAPLPDFTAFAQRQITRLRQARERRDGATVQQGLAELIAAASAPGERIMPPILACVRARASIGEISDALRSVWGVYRPA
jgi:methylmalonyl-CoA mutase N-terminal domain/subunit